MRIGLAGAGRIGVRHATALSELPRVETLVVADIQAGRARELAARVGARTAQAVETVDQLFASGIDGLVVTAATDAHSELVIRGVAAGLPVFCEKPIASDVSGTFQVVREAKTTGVPVQIGFQRRFDPGHVAAREAVESGRLGWLHTVRSCTLDPAPPPRDYIPVSGGLFRDCAVHDFDAVRFVTGREVVRVVAVGANRGDDIFRECDDVDTAAAVLTLDDGTIAVVSATRYNAAGYDVRFEALGSKESIVTGLDGRTPLTPVEGGAAGSAAPYGGFLDRFADAYDAELRAFIEVVAGRGESPCRPEEALEALYVAEACDISRHEGRAVELTEVRR
jgi:myo-inositol 2-dehydrogenase / D-chiro-inositol 1-dehydrogenase